MEEYRVDVCTDCLLVSQGYDTAELGHEPAPTDAGEWVIERTRFASFLGVCDFCESPAGTSYVYEARAERRADLT